VIRNPRPPPVQDSATETVAPLAFSAETTASGRARPPASTRDSGGMAASRADQAVSSSAARRSRSAGAQRTDRPKCTPRSCGRLENRNPAGKARAAKAWRCEPSDQPQVQAFFSQRMESPARPGSTCSRTMASSSAGTPGKAKAGIPAASKANPQAVPAGLRRGRDPEGIEA
jgi:hypothetical protein